MNKPLHERLSALHDFLSLPCENPLSPPALELLAEAVKVLMPPKTGEIAKTGIEMPWPNLPAGSRLVTSAYPRSVVADYGNARAAERDAIHAAAALVQPPEAPADEAGFTRDQWVHHAKRVYLACGDAEDDASGFARALADEQDWHGELDEPFEMALADIEGRPTIAPAAVEVSRLARSYPDAEMYRMRDADTLPKVPAWLVYCKGEPNVLPELRKHFGWCQYHTPVWMPLVFQGDPSALATMAPTPAPQLPSEAARLVGGEAATLTDDVIGAMLSRSTIMDRPNAIRMVRDVLAGHAVPEVGNTWEHVVEEATAISRGRGIGDLLRAVKAFAATQAAATDTVGEQLHAGSVAEAFWNGTLSERNKP